MFDGFTVVFDGFTTMFDGFTVVFDGFTTTVDGSNIVVNPLAGAINGLDLPRTLIMGGGLWGGGRDWGSGIRDQGARPRGGNTVEGGGRDAPRSKKVPIG